MKKILLFVAVLIGFSATSMAQWEAQFNDAADSRYPTAISTPSANVIWNIYADGSSDGANVQEYGRSIDGGLTWDYGTITSNNALEASSIFALDANTAWACMYGTPGQQGIFKTTDGGDSWTLQDNQSGTDEPMFGYSGSFANVVFFWNADIGFAMGDPATDANGDPNYFELYTTYNGGEEWTRVPSISIVNGTPIGGEYGYVDVYSGFISDTEQGCIYFGTNEGRIIYSTNYGTDWTAVASPVSDITNIIFSSPTKGWVTDAAQENGSSGYYGASLHGTDDFPTESAWNVLVPYRGNLGIGDEPSNMYSTDVTYVPGTDGQMLVSTGSAYYNEATVNSADSMGVSYSMDGGATWTLYGSNGYTFDEGNGTELLVDGYIAGQFMDVKFADAEHGFAGSFASPDAWPYGRGMWKFNASAPEIINYSIDGDNLTLTFNSDLMPPYGTTNNSTPFDYRTDATYTIDNGVTVSDVVIPDPIVSNQITLATSGLTEGTIYSVNIDVLHTVGGIVGTDISFSFELVSTVDIVSAEVLNDMPTVGQVTLVCYFNQELDQATAEDVDNYAITERSATIASATISSNLTQVSLVVDGLTTGNYTLEINDVEAMGGGNEAVSSSLDFTATVVGVATIEDGELNIYPNPFSGVLNVANASQVSKITVSNLVGQQVTVINNEGNNDITIDANQWGINGLYILTMEMTDGNVVSRKVMKQ